MSQKWLFFHYPAILFSGIMNHFLTKQRQRLWNFVRLLYFNLFDNAVIEQVECLFSPDLRIKHRHSFNLFSFFVGGDAVNTHTIKVILIFSVVFIKIGRHLYALLPRAVQPMKTPSKNLLLNGHLSITDLRLVRLWKEKLMGTYKNYTWVFRGALISVRPAISFGSLSDSFLFR